MIYISKKHDFHQHFRTLGDGLVCYRAFEGLNTLLRNSFYSFLTH